MISSTPIQYEEPWAEIFSSFIQYKRGLGLQYDRPEYELMALSKLLIEFSKENIEISQEAAETWCKRKDGESIKGWATRNGTYRQLAMYLNSRGISAFIPQSRRVKIPKYKPYIFNETEVKRMLSEAKNLNLSRQACYTSIFPIVLNLLFSTGARISEIVHLKVNDVDLDNATLYIHESKNRKSRIIPVDKTVVGMLKKYKNSWNGERIYFFETNKHICITHDRVYDLFRDVLFKAGIPHRGRGCGPRLHDIRHTFAVRSLKQMVNQGLDIYTALPYLSVYLGHKSVKETEYYLRLTAEIYPEIEEIASSYTGYVIPEVEYDESN